MAGHSKWNNIKKRKEAVDAKKGKVYTKLGKEITVIVKQGGPDPNVNAKLRDAIAKAKASNMPNENINRCIQKASGLESASNYEEITYEGYGPFGIAVIVEAMTDNKNRSAADIRCIFDRSNGTMGQTGSVGYMFNKKGVIIIEKTDNINEEELTLLAIEAGAEDFIVEEEYFEIITEVENFTAAREILEKEKYIFEEAEIKMVPTMKKELTDEEAETFFNFIDKMEDNDDVQNVWHNADV
ncbi:MAG: YebC/PmpR family DNA-binding transcriptional regulator [Clostridia bacterium]|nr:YebC/PmpR family DNA-binding transcriptional regulator [Clostridia bacterium]MDD4376052.1 YebC/PmpR family DNA-binding transcriptional regulator [Clostridia bacterium]